MVLEVPWVNQVVIRWLLDVHKYEFVLKAAFTHKTRYKPIGKGRPEHKRDYFMVKEIDRIMAEEGVTTREACRMLAEEQAERQASGKKDVKPRPIAPAWAKTAATWPRRSGRRITSTRKAWRVTGCRFMGAFIGSPSFNCLSGN